MLSCETSTAGPDPKASLTTINLDCPQPPILFQGQSIDREKGKIPIGYVVVTKKKH